MQKKIYLFSFATVLWLVLSAFYSGPTEAPSRTVLSSPGDLSEFYPGPPPGPCDPDAITLSTDNGDFPTGQMTQWTVPAGVTEVTMIVRGSDAGFLGGKGANAESTIPVNPGDLLNIIVGDFSEGYGGGGTGIYNTTTGTILIVAGGGGSPDASYDPGQGGRATENGGGGYYAGGANGNGGGGDSGGGGAFSAGSGPFGGGAGVPNGGNTIAPGSTGAFGFGGGGYSEDGGGGGGGGYSGGGGSEFFSGFGGGGGGSYVHPSGTNTTITAGADGIVDADEFGSAIICYTPAPACPPGNILLSTDNGDFPTGQMTQWTVPAGVTEIIVTTRGADGFSSIGGEGAAAAATLPVSPGDVLHVIVAGQVGDLQGGGGSGLYNATTGEVLIVAGGAGGGGGSSGQGGQATEQGGNNGGLAAAGGTNGSGGSAGSPGSDGGGGGGAFSPGASAGPGGPGGGQGVPNGNGISGFGFGFGFGGGGVGNGFTGSGGGGGGYSGGGGGIAPSGGGGGGSFVHPSGTNVSISGGADGGSTNQRGAVSICHAPGPVCDISIDNITPTDESCPGAEDGSITVSASCTTCSGIEYSIDGVNYQASNTFSGQAPGAYTVTVRDTGNPACEASDNTTVNGGPTTDSDGDGTEDCNDGCPNDPDKIAPGVCGCGVADTDSDGDGTEDCNDGCPNDPDKIAPGVCGCGVADVDSDGDGTEDCNDGCPNDPDKIAPGVCGCGVADVDSDGDGTEDCNDGCPSDPDKIAPGVCGCGVADDDTDNDGTVDCLDGCPNDPNKVDPGICGCGFPDDTTPEIDIPITIPVDPSPLGSVTNVSATFMEDCDKDDHAATWDWGDGSSSAGTVNQGGNSVTGSHTYAGPGVYTVTLTVMDGDGNQDVEVATTYVVIYDPNGGFVTGGGWIISPPGALVSDPLATGKANFGFVSKYQNGASVPTGNTTFHFKAGGFKFKSTDYEWMVIAGEKAKYKGTGEVNNSGNYGFMLTAIDGDRQGNAGPDKFRIKIWDRNVGDENNGGAVVYDNKMGASNTGYDTQELGGGSVTIHGSNGNGGNSQSKPGVSPNALGPVQMEAFPNPFGQQLTLQYTLPTDGYVRLSILSIHGQEVAKLVDSQQPAGPQQLKWTVAAELPAGVYFARLQTESAVSTLQLVLVK